MGIWNFTFQSTQQDVQIAVLNTPQKYWVTRLQTSNFSLLECVASKGEKKAIFVLE